MAAANPVQALQDEITCTICLDVFTDPMMIIGCGHNFCQACITRYWRSSFRNVSCPQCRATFSHAKLKPNRQLRNVAEVTRLLSLQSMKRPETGKGVCSLHQEPLKLFCQKDGTPICVVCDRAKEHRDHAVVPIEEAAQELKDQVQRRLETLRKQRSVMEEAKKNAEKASRELLEKAGAESQMFVAEIEQFCQVLKHQVQFLLPHLEELQADVLKRQDEDNSKHNRDIAQLSDLISDLERKCDQPGIEFLKEAGSISNSFEREQLPKHGENSADLEERLKKFSQQNITVKETLQRFKGMMVTELRKARDQALRPYAKANVILDNDTVHNLLILSEDQKSAWWDMEMWTEKPDHMKRFYKPTCVLGSTGFTSGRHCWEINVEEGDIWSVGVARESVDRTSEICFSPENGIWSVGFDEDYYAFTDPLSTPLNFSSPPRKIRVYLDYTAGQVSFFSVDTNTRIFTFPPATFGGETVYPWFWIEGGLLRLCW